MNQDPSKKKDNVIPLSEARKRQRTTHRAGAVSGRQQKSPPQNPLKEKLITGIQLAAFLFFVFWFMKTCQVGPS